MPSEELTFLEHVFRRRLRYTLEICNLRNIQLAQEYSAQYHVDLNPVVISYWLSGKRRIPLHHYPGVKTILASHLKIAPYSPEYGLEQELLDWDGLVYSDEQLKRERNRPRPIILGNLPRSSPGAGHFYRKAIRDEIVIKLLNPHPETGVFHPGVAVLTGLPGSGRSEMILEVLERVACFFSGGILFADLSQSPKVIWQEWGRRKVAHGQVLNEIDEVVRLRKGRWLLVAENINDGKQLQAILPSENIWVLGSAYGISALQPLGWEKYAFPLAPLSDDETIDWLKERLGSQWGKPYDKENARKLGQLIDGLPMAMAILSALVRSRGWHEVLNAMNDPKQAVSFIRYGSRQNTPTSSLSRAIDLAFNFLTPDDKSMLREMAMYAPGNPVPEEIFYNLLNDNREIVHELVEKGLLSRFENQRWRTTVLRMNRMVALHARERLPVNEGRVLARMVDFSAFMHSTIPDRLMPEEEMFDHLYAQRKMLVLAHDFWSQLGEETRKQRFEADQDAIYKLNVYARTGAYLTWTNGGAQAALNWLEAIRSMPFAIKYPEMDIIHPETRRLWADILFDLGNVERVSQTGKNVLSLMNQQFFKIGQAGKAGDIHTFMALSAEILSIQRQEPYAERFIWSSRSLRMLFHTFWEQRRYSDLLFLAEQILPVYLSFPWRTGLKLRWWDFKATLAAHGQIIAEEKLEALRAHEEKFQEALGQVDLSFTPLAEELLRSASRTEMASYLHELATRFKIRSMPGMERETLKLLSSLQVGKLRIETTSTAELPSREVIDSLEKWKPLSERDL